MGNMAVSVRTKGEEEKARELSLATRKEKMEGGMRPRRETSKRAVELAEELVEAMSSEWLRGMRVEVEGRKEPVGELDSSLSFLSFATPEPRRSFLFCLQIRKNDTLSVIQPRLLSLCLGTKLAAGASMLTQRS